MIAQTWERMCPDADTAILYVHGILGTPMQFEAFFPLAEGYSQCSLQLDGHGGDAKAFGKSSMEKWKAQVEAKVQALLQTHRYLILVAHSMGTLFAISESIRYSDRVKGIFLVDVPLSIRIRPSLIGNCWKVFRGRIRPEDLRALAAQRAYGIGTDRKIWRYLGWIPRYLELFREIRRVRTQVPRISVPCVAVQSGEDEMVAASASVCLRVNPGISVREMPHSTHFYYTAEDTEQLLQWFTAFLTAASNEENRDNRT